MVSDGDIDWNPDNYMSEYKLGELVNYWITIKLNKTKGQDITLSKAA